jgi:putative heme iron utilization protein
VPGELSHNERAAAALLRGARWFALATVDPQDEPATSYVPFAPVGGAFGIVVSALAAHAAHLEARPAVSLLAVGEEPAYGDPFARARIAIDAHAQETPRGSAEADAIWDALAARLGETAALLRTLPDFRAILLVPRRARLVLGFAAASDLDAAALERILRAEP